MAGKHVFKGYLVYILVGLYRKGNVIHPVMGRHPGKGDHSRKGEYPWKDEQPGKGKHPWKGEYPGKVEHPAVGEPPGKGDHSWKATGDSPGKGEHPEKGEHPWKGEYPKMGEHSCSPLQKIPARSLEGAKQPRSKRCTQNLWKCPNFRPTGARRGTHPTQLPWEVRGC
uniref:Uncharacterized protein n=1 Tax=Calidris pygmaea TaxID=425635 RepID=A0A8C3PQY2_9CHAR